MSDRGVGRGIVNIEPSTKVYLGGGGKVFLAALQEDGTPGAFRKVGNTPEFTITVNTESYEHNSTQDGAPAQDLSVITDSGASVGFTLENFSAENLALFLLGEASEYTNPGIAGFTGGTLCADGALEALGYYQILDTNDDPVFGITTTNAIDVATTNGTPVTLTEDTDYTVDANSGMVHVLDTAAVQTAISGSEGLTVGLTADVAATTVDLVTVLTDVEKDLVLKFQGINYGDAGKTTYYEFHKVSLAANGDANLISTEAAGMPMTGQVEVNDAYTNRVDIYTPATQV
jgi:hypothetical protein